MSFSKFIKKYISKELLFCFFVLLYSLTYIFFPSFLYHPVHDTKTNLDSYYLFYSELVSNNQFAFWNPYYFYGIDENLSFVGFSYSQYFFAIIGWIFKIQDAMLLFKLALSLEKLVLLLGVYLLSKRLFHSPLTSVFIGIGTVLTIHEGVQITFNFRIYSLVPFTIYFIYRFFQTLDIKYIIYTGILVLFSFLGNAPYMPPMYFLFYLLISIPLFVQYFPKIKTKKLKFRFVYIPFFLVLFFVYFIYFDILLNVFKEVELQSVSRGADGNVSLWTFLTYAGWPNFRFYFEFIFGIPSSHDGTYFIGSIPVVFFIYSLFIKRSHKFQASLYLTIIVLVLFSISYSSFMAVFIYHYMPLMKAFRLISLIVPLIKILVLLASGFGLDHLIQNRYNKDSKVLLLMLFSFFVLLIIVIDVFVFRRIPYDLSFYPEFNHYFYFHYFSIIIGLVLIIHLLNQEYSIRLILFLYLIEILSYYTFIHFIHPTRMMTEEEISPKIKNVQTISTKTTSEWLDESTRKNSIYRVKKMDFHDTRSYDQDLYRENPESYANINSFKFGVSYSYIYRLFYFDSCKQSYRYDFMSKPMNDLLRARYGLGLETQYANSTYLPSVNVFLEDYDFRSAIGCDTEKLRLVKNVNYTETKNSSAEYIRENQIYERPNIMIENKIQNLNQLDTLKSYPEFSFIEMDENVNYNMNRSQQKVFDLPVSYYTSENLKYGDVNGDGLSDMVYVDFSEQNRVFVNLNAKDGFVGFQLWLEYKNNQEKNRSFFYLKDIDNDKTDDILISQYNPEYIAHLQVARSTKKQFTMIGEIQFEKGVRDWTIESGDFSQDEIDYSMVSESQIQFGDCDGDGLLDVFYFYTKKDFIQTPSITVFVSRNSGNGQYARPVALYTKVGDMYLKGLSEIDKNLIREKRILIRDEINFNQIKLGDVNGDNKTDIIFYDAQKKKVFVSLSISETDKTKNQMNQLYSNETAWYHFLEDGIYSNHFLIGDMNRDGKDDFLFIDTKGNLSIAESSGKKFQVKPNKPIKLDFPFSMSQLKLDDINGDGCLDIVYFKQTKILYYLNHKTNFELRESELKSANTLIASRVDFIQTKLESPKDMILYSKKIEVIHFTSNQIQMKVKVSDFDKGSWLVYLDGFHPAWRARINGQEVPIHKVNLAFKGVYIENAGLHTVEFEFLGNHRNRFYAPVLVAISFLFSVWMILYFIRSLFPRRIF